MFKLLIRNFRDFPPKSRRFLSGVKRKYPINSEDAKTLPVFDYGVSKKTYKRVYVWGNIQTGALGIPYMKTKGDQPDRIEQLDHPRRLGFAEKFPVTTAACGFGFSLFGVDNSDSNVKLYGTGLNTDSQIGRHVIRAGHPLQIIYFPQRIPLPFKNEETTKITKIAAGRAHSIVLTDNEGIFLLGNNSYGQCGRRIIPDENYFQSNYVNHIPDIDGEKILDIEAGQDHTFALTEKGALYSCGWGADGQTGLGHFNNTEEFTKVKGDVENEEIIRIKSRSDFALALNSKGQVFGWGNAEYGQIVTVDNAQQVSHPTHFKNLEKLGVMKDLAAAGTFCLVLNEQGEVFVWGFGLLGAGPALEQSLTPVKLPETLFGRNDFNHDSKVVKITCGLSYAMAVTNKGDMFAWGRNSRSCLGLGEEKDQFFPFKVSLGGFVKDVWCGADHTVALCEPYI